MFVETLWLNVRDWRFGTQQFNFAKFFSNNENGV